MRVRKQSSRAVEPVAAPNRAIRELFSRTNGGADGVTVRLVELHPADEQAARRPHRHAGFEEVIYVLTGHGRLWADGVWTPIVAGDALLVPSGVWHATFNEGERPLRLLCFFPVAAGVDARERADFQVDPNAYL